MGKLALATGAVGSSANAPVATLLACCCCASITCMTAPSSAPW